MGVRRNKQAPEPTREPDSLIASAVQLRVTTESPWRDFRLRDEQWQVECWRMYDIIGALHFAAGYIGNACSRVRIYVAEVDDKGRPGDEVTNDEEIQALADTLFGGPSHKAEALRSIGINLTVAGECYLVGRAARQTEPDKWMVLSTSELRRLGDRLIINFGFGREELVPNQDIVIRLWTPHPRRIRFADSPTRAALPILREIERLTQFVFSQIDSRLAGAGILPMPNNLEFPTGDGDPMGAEGLMQQLVDAANASLTGQGTAASVVPIIVEVDPEVLGSMPEKPIRFESELSDKAKDLRDEAYGRLAQAMDLPAEVITGVGDTNHWNSFAIDETSIKNNIEPLMTRICNALTLAYLHPVLKLLGKDPNRYTYWFDTAPLTLRPERLKETLELYTEGVVNSEAVLRAGNYNPTTDALTQKEDTQRFLRDLLLRDPTLFQIEAIREAAGFPGIEIISAEVVEGDINQPGPAAPPPPDRVIGSEERSAIPSREESTANGGGQALTSSAAPVSPIFVAAHATVLRALELAGKRLLTPTYRGQFPTTPPHELHTKIRVSNPRDIYKMLSGAWEHVPTVFEDLGVDVDHMRSTLERYCVILISRNAVHRPQYLESLLRESGII